MLEPKDDRLDYGKMLVPPLGTDWSLELAVATTYSLDMQILVAVCISLGLFESTDSALLDNPVSLLRAVLKVSDKLVVFCESGQISNPQKRSKLHLLLEHVIVPVTLKETGHSYPSFHPKTWTLIFKDKKGRHAARFINMSRNMTFDRSWDAALVLDGKEEEGGGEGVGPLIRFMEYLHSRISKDIDGNGRKRKLLRHCANVLGNIRLKTDNRAFTDFRIEPVGIGAFDYFTDKDEALMTENYNDIMIFSPFLSADILADFAQMAEGRRRTNYPLKDCRRMLVTRKSALEDKEIIDVLKKGHYEVWVLKDDIVSGEDMLDEGDGAEPKGEDIHAKMYLYRKYSNVYFYVGSMNASHKGFCQNVEMMVRLKANNRYFNLDVLKRDLFGDGKDNAFEPVDLGKYDVKEPAEEEKAEAELKSRQQKVLKWLCRNLPAVDIIACPDGTYTMRLAFSHLERIAKDVAITETTLNGPNHVCLSPITLEGRGKPLDKEVEFASLGLDQLTSLFRITVFCHGTDPLTKVVVMPCDLPEQRDRTIVRDIIKDNGFLNYVSFVLSDDPIEAMTEIIRNQALGGKGSTASEKNRCASIYESMLKAAYENPSKLEEVDKIRRLMGTDDVVPEQFDKLYDTFKTTLKLK